MGWGSGGKCGGFLCFDEEEEEEWGGDWDWEGWDEEEDDDDDAGCLWEVERGWEGRLCRSRVGGGRSAGVFFSTALVAAVGTRKAWERSEAVMV